MFRRFGGWVSIASAVLCIAVIVEWVRSRHHADVLLIRTPAGRVLGSAAIGGGMLFAQSDLPYDGAVDVEGRDHSVMIFSPMRDEFSVIENAILDTPALKFNFLGFKTAAAQTPITASLSPRFSALVLPYWSLVIVMAILPSGIGRAALTRRSRRRNGLCIACGYDIRASSGRCPECGRETTAAASAHPKIRKTGR